MPLKMMCLMFDKFSNTVFFIVILFVTLGSALGTYEQLLPESSSKYSAEVQAKAAKAVITRLLGFRKSQLFNVEVKKNISDKGRDTFHIFKRDDDVKVTIIGSSGVAVTWGFYYYLKYYCFCHISWDGDQLNIPKILPSANVTKSSLDKFRYYQNVCTSSYSFVWWNWTRWEREIDWMALNGINLALTFTAQEAIWKRVYDGLGLKETGFTGPAYLAWNRMGNIRNFGRGLSSNWHTESVALQHLILKRMRELGIIPVIPCFSGIVPRSYKIKFPDADVVNITRWASFGNEFCCPYLLNPTDPMFPVISRIFLREYVLEFGTNHIYNCDTFNENTPPSNDVTYLASSARSVYNGIIQVDPLAIWMVQGWMFIHPFWGKEQVKSYVTSVPNGKMLILDLQSGLTPQYQNFASYYGQPFIWCTLNNFGGQLGIYGYLNLVNEGIQKARTFPNSSMVGIGITPEGIDQNYIMYEFTLDNTLRLPPTNLTKWVSFYILRRYKIFNEHLNEAWHILKETAYNYNPDIIKVSPTYELIHKGYRYHIAKNILTKRPSLSMDEILWYNRSEMLMVLEKFILAAKMVEVASSKLFLHDFIDVTRQVIQLAIGSFYNQLMHYYESHNLVNFQITSDQFLGILHDLDDILKTGKKFLLGAWLNDAKNTARNVNESIQYEYNARNQITLWGPKGEIRDYAAKQWSGLIADYYIPRWNIFIAALNKSLVENVKYDSASVKMKMFTEVEQPFTFARKNYSAEPEGDTVETINNFYIKWNKILYRLFKSGK